MPTHDPPLWEVFDSMARSHGASHFGFFGRTGDVNRFAARYRAARSLMSIELQGFSGSIKDGYTSLVRLLLTWSAFEYLLLALGVNKRDSSSLFSAMEHEAVVAELRSLDGHSGVFSAVKSYVGTKHCTEIERYLAGQTCDALALAGAIRHAFAHGHLAPSAGGTEAIVTTRVCVILAKHLFRLMDNEFRSRIESVSRNEAANLGGGAGG